MEPTTARNNRLRITLTVYFASTFSQVICDFSFNLTDFYIILTDLVIFIYCLIVLLKYILKILQLHLARHVVLLMFNHLCL